MFDGVYREQIRTVQSLSPNGVQRGDTTLGLSKSLTITIGNEFANELADSVYANAFLVRIQGEWPNANMAQSVAQLICNQSVIRSSRIISSISLLCRLFNKHTALHNPPKCLS